jgi:hypothetical protein
MPAAPLYRHAFAIADVIFTESNSTILLHVFVFFLNMVAASVWYRQYAFRPILIVA